MLALFLVVAITSLHIAEIKDCKKVEGVYSVVHGCSVETFKPNIKHLGLPKSLRDLE